jgi:hypothetical protein
MEWGQTPTAGFEEFTKLSPDLPAPSVAVASTALLLLVSRNETVPVGARGPTPPTVAVSV